MMGRSLDESEELVKRVVGVVDSTDHFILQTIPLLEEVWIRSRLACMCVLCVFCVCVWLCVCG